MRERYVLINREVTTYMGLYEVRGILTITLKLWREASREDYRRPACHIKSRLSTGRMVHGLGTSPRVRASLTILPDPSIITLIFRLGETIFSAYNLNFQTHLFSILPPSFSRGFKALCDATLPPPDPEQDQEEELHSMEGQGPSYTPPRSIWLAFETLGLLDRYESIVASVGYEHIEAHVLKTCTQRWEKPMLEDLRGWMSDKMVSWMLMPYAREAKSGVCLRSLQWISCFTNEKDSGRGPSYAPRRWVTVRFSYEQNTM